MYLLPAHTVQLVLQYISPLSDPLPPHLISTPLRQRHHFLQITTASPVEYLCWPDPDNAKTIELFDRLPPLSDHASFPTRYTSDSQSPFAHVQISSDAQGLRMVFHWDDSNGWRYHDLRLMPFPSSSYSTPQESLASGSVREVGPDHLSNGDEDSYWDAYGVAEHDRASPLPLQGGTDAIEGEDTYWAQYASVQGSADSTVPSPLPTHRKFRPVNSTDDGSAFSFPSQNNPIIDIPVHAIHSRPLASRVDPPSPNTLAHLLSTISRRKEIFSPVLDDPDVSHSPSAYSTDPSPEQTAEDSELVTPPMPDGYLDASIVAPVAFKLNGTPLSECPSRPPPEDTALADSIKGLYYLWRAGRNGEQDEKGKNAFLQIVQAAIAYD